MKLVALIIVLSSISTTIIIAGTGYAVFWLGFSGWWWVLAITFIEGECISCYKLVNAILFNKPLVWGKVP